MSLAEDTRDQVVASADDPDRRVLIKGATVISMDPDVGDFERADILVEGKHISAVSPDLDVDPAGAVVVDGEGHVAIPGLQDTHRHSWQTVFRRMFVDVDLGDYIDQLHMKIGPCVKPEDSQLGNLLAGLGALESGITTVMDFSHNTRTAAHSEALVEGWLEAGIRAVHAQAAPAFGDWDGHWPDNLEALQSKYFSSADQLLTLRMAVNMPIIPGIEHVTLTAEKLEHARRLGIRTSVDAVFGPDANARLVELGKAGALGPDITYIHCQDIDDEGWNHIVDSGGTVSLAPTSDANLGQMSSITPVQKALDMGIHPALSCDVECSLCTDMFAQMQAVLTIQRLFAYNRGFNGEENAPAPISSRQVLEFATVNGARANNLIDKSGTLTPGKEADLVLVDAMSIRTMPMNSAMGTVVMGTDSNDVRAVFVAGAVRKWDGKLVGVDLDSLRRRATESRDRLLRDAGLERDLFN